MFYFIKNNFLIFSFLSSILLLKLCSSTAENDDDDFFGDYLINSRSSVSQKYYKCYQGEDESSTECIGKVCIRVTHNQSGADKLSCKNFTEPDDPQVGKCKKINDGQMPGQSEEMCVCEGDYCNGSRRSFASNLIISLCLLTMCLSMTILCSVLYRRNFKKYPNSVKEIE